MTFFRQFIHSPRTIGAICPGSQSLAHTLVEMCLEKQCRREGIIVDLGSGTGIVTQELLKRGILPELILAVDICGGFKNIFNKNYPNVALHIGDARNLHRILFENFGGSPVSAIISSLPLRSMSQGIVAAIMQELRTILIKYGSSLIQYTYALWLHASLARYGFSLAAHRYIFANMPPCLVEKYVIR